MEAPRYRVERLVDAPIVGPESHPSLGPNIQGPSLIRTPRWLPGRLGEFHLYFADHKGSYIRLAHADDLRGPWTVHPPGSLQLADSLFLTEPPPHTEEQLDRIREAFAASGGRLLHDVGLEVITPHIASPDVHVDEESRRLVMYFHGLEGLGRQVTRVATSLDGIAFTALAETVEHTYLRVVHHRGRWLGLAMPGQFYESPNGIDTWRAGPRLFVDEMRHSALRLRDDVLEVFWTRVGDAPERVLLSTIDISGDWADWTVEHEVEILRPERTWEGADAPNEPSLRSVAYGLVNQLRDPAIFLDDGRAYMVYAVGGESGLGIAELIDESELLDETRAAGGGSRDQTGPSRG